MKIYDFAIVNRNGVIHRPSVYVIDKSCGWQWQGLRKSKTGHWSLVLGRIAFTSM